jgi:tetratricopeptide (TPR) repeat protein
MEIIKNILFSMMYLGLLQACASRLVIQSDTSPVEVFAVVEGQKEKIKIGDTPFEITETKLYELLNLSPESTGWFQLDFTKKEFQTKSLLVPTNRWGEVTKVIKVTLDPLADETTLSKKIINYFFNAKKYADFRQFPQAHEELEKILAIDPKIAQAVAMKAGLFFLEGNIEQSKILYRKALEIDPSFNDAIQMLEKIKNKEDGRQ